MTSSRQIVAPDAVAAVHPLDPLSLEEVRVAIQTVRRGQVLGESHRFPLTRLDEPTKAEIILYCGGGFRSALAAESLQKMGYTQVFSVAGGWRDWLAKGGPSEK